MIRPFRFGFMIVCSVGLCASMPAHAIPGQVSIRGGIVQWGQYNNIKHVIAVSTTSENLAETIRAYPVSGTSCVLIHAQRPGQRVFSADGKTIDPGEQDRLLETIRTVNTFDMLPIVVLFDPDERCHLQSPKAYAKAATTLSRLIEDADLWYLPCIVADGTSDQWRSMKVSQIIQRSALGIREIRRNQVIAAGSNTPRFNRALFETGSPVQVLAAYAEKPGTLSVVGDHPVIELLRANTLDLHDLSDPLEQTYKEPNYGFAIDLEDGGEPEREEILNEIFALTDAYHKQAWPATPLDPADAFSLKPGEAEEGFRSLFNGKNLNGWVQLTDPGNFEVRDGAIELVGKSGGWLRSWDVYDDFVFRAEYWIEEGGNAGFYIRTPAIGRQSRIGFEFQIMGQPASLAPRKDTTGAIYDVRPPDANYMKLGDWNEVELTCEGSRIRVMWNGNLAHDFRYEELDAMKTRAQSGFIGLQDHQSSVKYRNLRIKRLPARVD